MESDVPSEIALGPFSLRTFTFALALAIITTILLTLRRQERRGVWLDVCLGALAGGIVVARLFHVLLHWDYFADNIGEAFRLNAGGLDWHGAVLGGLIGLWLAARWRKLRFPAALDALTLALPLLALASWAGCLASACGYGAEVDTLAHYSPFVVSETPDIYGIVAPRYNTQLFGILLALGLLLITVLLFWRGWLVLRRFWLVLALLSLCLFVIGFYRGDAVPLIAGLRADQWLDGMLVAISVQRLAFSD
jgi:prolipoprotein diacylglyceryltransferase